MARIKSREKYFLRVKVEGEKAKVYPYGMSRSYAYKMKHDLLGLSKYAGVKVKIQVFKKKKSR